ncbi:MAG: methylenetetrahydrofolate reductase [NAD(P)H] [candidate division WOR-3 bacterium]
MRVCDILKKDGFVLSFEFFPPRKKDTEINFWETVERLSALSPDFVSMTYGAGGSTHEKSIELVLKLKSMNLNTVAHITCISTPIDKLKETLNLLKMEGIENLLALRGDTPQGWERPPGEYFSYAWQLVELAASYDYFCIGVAGYPEGHIEAKSLEEDIKYLKFKVDKGAHFVITQLFFDNRFFYDFVERARKAGIEVPIIPGIMPITNYSQVTRFTEICGASIPSKLYEKLEKYKDNPEEIKKVGVEYTILQCKDLIDQGVKFFHFYTLNTYSVVERIVKETGIR